MQTSVTFEATVLLLAVMAGPGFPQDDRPEIPGLDHLRIVSDLKASEFPPGPLATQKWIINRKSRSAAYLTGAAGQSGTYSLGTTWEDEPRFVPGSALEFELHGWDQQPKKSYSTFPGSGTYQIALSSKVNQDWSDRLKLTVAFESSRMGVSFGRWSGYAEAEHRIPFEDANWNHDGKNQVIFTFDDESVSLWINGEYIDSQSHSSGNNRYCGYALSSMTRDMGASRIRIFSE